MNRPRASRVFYGWYVVAAAFAVTFVGFGSAYTFSAFVEPLQREFAASLVAFALVFGVFYGGWVAVLPALVMDCFGGRNVSGIIGVLYTSVAFGTLIGPAAAGFVYDAGGGYLVPILASAAANAIAFAIVAATGRAPASVRAPSE